MRVKTKRCPPHLGGCGETAVVEMTEEQFLELMDPNGRHIQEILADQPADTRERFLSGICPTCWTKLFGDEDEGEEPPIIEKGMRP